jgi:glycosyltransferase involved in cell wall biosynthesis
VTRHILHITDSLGRTGVASQVLGLSRALVEKGYAVHVAALGTGGSLASEFQDAGIPTTELRRRWKFDPVAAMRLRRLVRTIRPDVIHTWNSEAALYGQLAVRGCDMKSLVAGQYRIEPWQTAPTQWIQRRMVLPTTQLVVSSGPIRDWWANTVGLANEKITVIAPGVAPARPSDRSRDELLSDLRLPSDARLIGAVGRLVPEKRVKDLIWAADLLRVLHDNLRLLIIGDGPLRVQLEQYARMASDLEHIQFLGERADLWRIMPHLDVLWDANERRSQSIAILEAMAAGVPVIASDTLMNREFIAEGKTGYLIPLLVRSGRADRARNTDRVFNDHEESLRLAENGRRHVAEQFNLERFVQKYVDVYERAAQ